MTTHIDFGRRMQELGQHDRTLSVGREINPMETEQGLIDLESGAEIWLAYTSRLVHPLLNEKLLPSD